MMSSVQVRRCVIWLLCGLYVASVGLLVAVVVWAMVIGDAGNPKFILWMIGFFVFFTVVLLMPALPAFQRIDPILAGIGRRELLTLFNWLIHGDPLGRQMGRNHCHRCNYERGTATTCSECGAERIDPI